MTADFEVTGDGRNPALERASSHTSLYVLFDGTDSLLTASLEGDYLKLPHEDDGGAMVSGNFEDQAPSLDRIVR